MAPFNLEAVLERFEDAWQQGTAPRIEQFLPTGQSAAGSGGAQRQLLQELVKLDLSYRWRRRTGDVKPLLLEEYCARYPELGPAAQAPLELIAAEYWVRSHHGDQPNHQEYESRFGRHGPNLHQALRQVDAELAAEFAGPPAVAGGAGPTATLSSVAELVDALQRHPLLPEPQQAELKRELHQRFREPRALAKELLQRGWLTPYQLNQLLLGRAAELVLGPYVVLERLGEGGAGRVLKARHQRMDRIVALKQIRRELLADPEVVGRFYREIEIIGKLSHPNIVHAFDAGPLGGTHVLVMEYVEGIDLGRLVRESGPLPVGRACEYVRQTALGLDYAHRHGLVHRDIKPPNLLLHQAASEGKHAVKILDLGLARLRAPQKEARAGDATPGEWTSMLTPVGGVLMMGTPDYLAPEQALDFHGADIRADIYSLGCTFFFLLTGQPPFAGGTVPQKLVKHQQVEPPPLASFRADVPPKVEAILRRMLAKKPDDRFATPGAVAAALELLQTAGVIAPDTPVRRAAFGCFSPRNLGRAAWNRPRVRQWLAGFLLLSALLIALWAAWPRGPGTHSPAGSQAAASALVALNQRDILTAERFDWQPKELVAVRGEHRWHTPERVSRLAVSADGRTIASADGYVIRLWDTDTGRERMTLKGHVGYVQSLALDSTSRTLASGSQDMTVRLWNLDTGNARVLSKQAVGGVPSLAFARDGKFLACGLADGQVKLLDVVTGAERAIRTVGTKEVTSLDFPRDGQLLAAASADGTVRLWDYPGFKEPTVVRCGERQQVAFFADGRTLASGQYVDPIKVWNVAPFAVRTSWKLDDGQYLRSLAAAPDGKTLATGFLVGSSYGPCGIRLWDPATGKPCGTLAGHSANVNDLAFFPDSRTLVSGGSDGTLRLWDVATGQERAASRSRWGRYYPTVACPPDGALLAAARLDDSVTLWDIASGTALGNLAEPSRAPVQPGIGPDGQPMVWRLSNDRPLVREVRSGKERTLPYTIPSSPFTLRMTLAPDGKTLALPGKGGVVQLRDFATGQELTVLRGTADDALDLQYAPDGKCLLSLERQGRGKQWHVDGSGEPTSFSFAIPGFTPSSAAPSAGGELIALGGSSGAGFEVVLWDSRSSRPLERWGLPWSTRPTFAPDGRYLILSNANGTVYVLRLK